MDLEDFRNPIAPWLVCLRILEREGVLSTSTVQREGFQATNGRVFLRLSSVTSLLKRLEAAGAVTSWKPSPTRSTRHWQITDTGRWAANEGLTLAREALDI